MAYWQEIILNRLSLDTINSNTRLQKHREMWVGSIIAAALTQQSGIPHFTGLPEDEPPDVNVIFLEPQTYKDKPSLDMWQRQIEIIRCNLTEGESLASHIAKKNLPAYSGYHLCVYAMGGGMISQEALEALSHQLKTNSIYLSEVFILFRALSSSNITLPDDTYALTWLYPHRSQIFVNLGNEKAFFHYPEVLKMTGRRLSRAYTKLGGYELLPPNL